MKKLLAILPLLIFFVSPFQAHAALTTNLVSYWKLDEASGNVTDSVASIVLTQNGSPGHAAGKINNGVQVTSNTTFFAATNAIASALNLTGDMSISLWVKFAGFTNGSDNFFFGKDGPTTRGYMFRYLDPTGGNPYHLFWERFQNNSTGGSMTCPFTPSTGVWYNLVVTSSGTSSIIYINGVAQTMSGSLASSFQSPTDYAGINQYGNAGSNANFNIDEIGIWSRALTPTEVTQLYNSGAGLQYPFTIPATVPYAFANLFSWW